MVCQHWQRQPAECLADAVWSQHLPGELITENKAAKE